jgi:hypothetical protein
MTALESLADWLGSSLVDVAQDFIQRSDVERRELIEGYAADYTNAGNRRNRQGPPTPSPAADHGSCSSTDDEEAVRNCSPSP